MSPSPSGKIPGSVGDRSDRTDNSAPGTRRILLVPPVTWTYGLRGNPRRTPGPETRRRAGYPTSLSTAAETPARRAKHYNKQVGNVSAKLTRRIGGSSPRSKDRLTRLQLLLRRNPSPRLTSARSHQIICYYHQDLQRRRLQAGSRPDPSTLTAAPSYSPPRHSYIVANVDTLRRRPGIGTTLDCHPFSGPVASAGESLHTP